MVIKYGMPDIRPAYQGDLRLINFKYMEYIRILINGMKEKR